MQKRREFLKRSILGAAAVGLGPSVNGSFAAAAEKASTSAVAGPDRKIGKPIVISTWNFGIEANEAAWKVLNANGRALDAVEQGVHVPEADPSNRSVGLGGLPDRDGHVTLDSCIMDEKGNCGSVAFLEHIVHPVSVARKVMEETPHVMLVGEGALQFALSQGFSKTNLLTPEAEKTWKKWLKEKKYEPVINIENHDTISMLAIDSGGDMSGACTTSGLAYKMHGRVGDSPIIGAALFVDNEVGGACATGHGEFVMKTVGSFLVVELMRQGASPGEACKTAVERIVNKYANYRDIQVGYLAMNKQGEYGSYSIHKGFSYAVHDQTGNRLIHSDHYISE